MNRSPKFVSSHIPNLLIFLPCGHVPNSDFAIASTADKNVVPRDHRPYTHHMALQHPLIIAIGVIHVDSGIVHGEYNILGGEVQACDDALVCRDVSLSATTSLIPSRLDQILLLEMGPVRIGSASAFPRRAG